MSKVIDAVFEGGVFRPFFRIEMKEHTRVHLIIKETESTAIATSGIIPAKNGKIVDEIAREPEFLPEEI